MSGIKGTAAFLLISINAAWWCTLLYVACLPCLLMPGAMRRSAYTGRLHWIVDCWVTGNHVVLNLLRITRMNIDGTAGLKRSDWSLVVANHQTWADIVVLQCTLLPHAPVLKFFMKRELIWVPFIGLGCWLLDFPFMRRYSAAVLERHPELRNKDQETTQRACARFRLTPTAALNFAEGTRFTLAKHAAQASPHQHLLRPRAGGLGFVLAALGEKLHHILDVTIVYSNAHAGAQSNRANAGPAGAVTARGAPTFWEFLCGHSPHVDVHVRVLPVPAELIGGDYAQDEAYRARIRDWVDRVWAEKDQRIAQFTAN